MEDAKIIDVKDAEVTVGTSDPHPYRLRKARKLRLRNLVDSIFRSGSGLYEYPLRLQWKAYTAEDLDAAFRMGTPRGIAPVQMMITVPKKKHRHAVDRVLMRRRVREAWRLNSLPLVDAVEAHPQIRTLSIAFVYISPNRDDYQRVEKAMKRLINKLLTKLSTLDLTTDTVVSGNIPV